MKKILSLSMLLMAFAFLGCNRQNNPQPAQPNPLPVDIADYDMLMLDNGDLYFYNSKTAAMTLLEAEEDSIVNCLFTGDNKVYYSVVEGPKILLRCIDLEQPNPQPKQLADWGVPYEECVTETYGEVSPLEYY